MFETISLSEPRPGVSLLRLERRTKLNSLNEQMIDDLEAAAGKLAARNPDAIVIEGAGHRAFSIGLDTKAPITRSGGPTNGETIAIKAQRVMDDIASLPAPVVAAIEGYALGGGFELALAADVRVGGKSAVMGLPEITQGLIPGAGGTQRLPALVGRGRAVEMLFTGDKYTAKTMSEWGVLSEVVADEEVSEAALDCAEDLSGADDGTTQDIKRMVDANSWGTTEGYLMERTGLSRALSLDPFGDEPDAA